MKISNVIKSLSASNAAIKNTASLEPKDGWYPTYSASGQDVWLPNYRFEQKGIVVSAVGARCGKAFKADGKWNVCANTHPLSVDETIADRDYCWYMLNNENWWIKGGTAQPFIKVKDSLNREHDFPSIDVQKEIVAELNKISSIITLRKAELQKLDELIKARFVEMFGDLKTNPKGWPILSFPEFAEIDGNMTTDYERYADYPHIGIDSIEKGTGKLSGYRTVREDGVISGKYIFTPKHIIYSKIRPNLNKVALPDFYGLCSADAYPVLPNYKNCNRIFLATAMRSEYFLEYILQFSSRTNLPKVNRKEIAGFRMPLPPLSLQEQFATFVEQVDKSKLLQFFCSPI